MKGSEQPVRHDAYQKALELLTGRDYSRAGLRSKLARRGFAEEELDEALERLSSQGLIDDARFAAGRVDASLRSGRGFGVKLLVDLGQKGVSRETARQAVTAAMEKTTAEQILADVVTKKFASFDNKTATQKERQRVYSYLQRRGFPLAAIIDYFRSNDMEQDK